MNELGWLLVIVCGGIFAALIIVGTAEAIAKEITMESVLFATGCWTVFLGLLSGLYYGLSLVLEAR